MTDEREPARLDPNKLHGSLPEGRVARWGEIWRRRNPDCEPILTMEYLDELFGKRENTGSTEEEAS